MGTQGKNLGAKTEAETSEEHYLLACLSWLSKAAFLYNTDRTIYLGWYRPQWADSSHISHEFGKCLHRLLTGHTDGGIASAMWSKVLPFTLRLFMERFACHCFVPKEGPGSVPPYGKRDQSESPFQERSLPLSGSLVCGVFHCSVVKVTTQQASL